LWTSRMVIGAETADRTGIKINCHVMHPITDVETAMTVGQSLSSVHLPG
jgi:hypothetical protein